MGEIFTTSFFLILLASISPLPALPVILDAYSRHSFLAMPFVFCATTVSSLIYYYIGRFSYRFGIQNFVDRAFRLPQSAFPKSIRSLSLIEHTCIRLCAVVPYRLYSLSCGALRIPISVYIGSLIIPFIFYNSLYALGIGALQNLLLPYCPPGINLLCSYLPVILVWLLAAAIVALFSRIPLICSFRTHLLTRFGLARSHHDI